MHTAMAWTEFGILALIIAAAGYRLSVYGDVIATVTGLGGAWIGLVLMATVTSLPELVTGISAVAIAELPDIAVGDVFGSCVFNLVLIVIADFLSREESIYTRIRQGHVLAAGFGVILIGFAGLNVMVGQQAAGVSLLGVGYYTPVIVALYFVAIRTVFLHDAVGVPVPASEHDSSASRLTLRQAVVRYALLAAVVLVCGVRLPYAAQQVAVQMDWNMTFVGTTFVALTTSLPEMVVTLTAVRIGALDMAVGNIFGSNLFNILILAIDDLLYRPGPIFAHVSAAHAFSAITAMTMTGVAIVGLLYRPKTRALGAVGWGGLFMLSLFLFNLFVIYLHER